MKYLRAISAFIAASVAISVTCAGQTPDYSEYILTPKAPATPRINGPRVYGQSSDVDFLFKIPASGERPMTFSDKGLPKGLKLDPETGIISGRARKAGSYNVTLTATNSLGSDSKPLRLEIG